MKVLVESSWWDDGPPSGKNVVRSIFHSWEQKFPDDDLVRSDKPQGDNETAITRVQRRLPTQAARSLALVGGNADLVLTQNFASQLIRNGSQGTFVHDVLWLRHPEWFTRKERIYLAGVRPSLRRADIIFASSETEAQKISTFWPETTSRLVVTGLGVPEGLRSATPTRPPRFREDPTPYILSVGRLNARKNIKRLVEAFTSRVAVDHDADLVIVGTPDGATEKIGIPPAVRSRVHFTGRTTDAELRWLYENATLFVFPSLDEGYGLPLIEARSFGTPSAASDIGIFREVGADFYFDPLDVESMAWTMGQALQRRPTILDREIRDWGQIVGAMRSSVGDIR